MSGPNDEPIRSRGQRLDQSPEEQAAEHVELLAHILTQYLHDRVRPDSQAEYTRRFVGELFERVPGARDLLVAEWLEEVCEEVARRAPSTESHAIVELLTKIEQDWKGR